MALLDSPGVSHIIFGSSCHDTIRKFKAVQVIPVVNLLLRKNMQNIFRRTVAATIQKLWEKTHVCNMVANVTCSLKVNEHM